MPAHRRAGWLLYAAITFVVLTGCAMVAYPGGAAYDPSSESYRFFDNFLSDLGATRTFSGRTNLVASVLFLVALTTIGAALVAFAQVWRSFAFEQGRANAAGRASQIFGTLSGVAFVGVGFTPWNLVLLAHNTLVVAAFALLLCYVISLTILLQWNRASRVLVIANVIYLAMLCGYVALVLRGPRFDNSRGLHIQVMGQKAIVYGSMLHIIVLTVITRRVLARRPSAT